MDVRRKITSLLYPGITVDLSRGINSRVIYGENSAPSPNSVWIATPQRSSNKHSPFHIGAFSLHQSRGWLLLSLWTEGPHGVRIRTGHVRVLYDDPWTHQSSRFLRQPPSPVPIISPSSNKTLTSKPKITSHCHNEDICLSNNVSTINCIGVNEESARLLVERGLGLDSLKNDKNTGGSQTRARDGALRSAGCSRGRGRGSRVEQLHHQLITAWITVWQSMINHDFTSVLPSAMEGF